MSIMILQNQKTAFLGYKNKNSKKSKTLNFFKGVNPWFWSKNGHFSNFFFQAIRARKISFMIFSNEKMPFQATKTKSPKIRKIDIFPKGLTHGFGPTMVIFSSFFFQPIQARIMSFKIFQNEKRPFQAIETRTSKSQKIDIFPKGLTHGFGPKMAIYSNFFFLANIGQDNVLDDILERKNAFLAYKKKNFKKSKN